MATKQHLHRSLAYTQKASDATVSLGGAEIVLGQKPVQQTVDVGVTVSGKRAFELFLAHYGVSCAGVCILARETARLNM